jgi:rare lipoprotein A
MADTSQITAHSNTLRRTAGVMALMAAVSLAGCDKMPKLGADAAGDEAAGAVATDGTSLVERDIEAPEVFSVSEPGLWDGRPSLGGVWVAHPKVTDPERVIIRNTANDKFVIGALFRRELENPGPALQVSSDAAEALGILAGSPTMLSVIALRREEGPAPTQTAITDFDAPEVIAATPLEPAGATGAEPAPAITTELAPAAPAPEPTSDLGKPFIQIGNFSVETNANATADRLRGNGLSARVLSQSSQGKSFWRVIVGPAPTVSDRSLVLEKIKGLGFPDAYAVTN